MRPIMIDTAASAEVDRRKFLSGHWPSSNAAGARAMLEIASILVQARPERLDAVVREIEALGAAQVFSRDPRGKVVVVIEASDVGVIGGKLATISLLPDVLNASLVFHGTDED
jgi:nitrate reductase NapD